MQETVLCGPDTGSSARELFQSLLTTALSASLLLSRSVALVAHPAWEVRYLVVHVLLLGSASSTCARHMATMINLTE